MQRLIRSAWLLRQADELGYRDAGRGQPRNSNLRRAVSAAYYALFHAIAWAVARHLVPSGGDAERARLTRSISHEALRTVCRWVAKGDVPPVQAAGLVDTIRADLSMVRVTNAFLELREQRHAADYDHLAEFSKPEVLALIDAARAAVAELDHLRASDSDSLIRFLALVSLKTGIR